MCLSAPLRVGGSGVLLLSLTVFVGGGVYVCACVRAPARVCVCVCVSMCIRVCFRFVPARSRKVVSQISHDRD